jgi:hypothetical protein
VNEEDQDREEDKGQEEVPICLPPQEKGEDEGQGDEVMAESVEDASPQEKEPGREREEVSELTFTAGDPRADLGHSGTSSRSHGLSSISLYTALRVIPAAAPMSSLSTPSSNAVLIAMFR